MINSSFQSVEPQVYGDLPETQTQESSLWNILAELTAEIDSLAKVALNFLIKNAFKLIEFSFKIIGAAVDVTILKVQELTANISQLNLNFINLAPQTTIHHHVVNHNHYYTCAHCTVREKGYRQPLGLAY